MRKGGEDDGREVGAPEEEVVVVVSGGRGGEEGGGRSREDVGEDELQGISPDGEGLPEEDGVDALLVGEDGRGGEGHEDRGDAESQKEGEGRGELGLWRDGEGLFRRGGGGRGSRRAGEEVEQEIQRDHHGAADELHGDTKQGGERDDAPSIAGAVAFEHDDGPEGEGLADEEVAGEC